MPPNSSYGDDEYMIGGSRKQWKTPYNRGCRPQGTWYPLLYVVFPPGKGVTPGDDINFVSACGNQMSDSENTNKTNNNNNDEKNTKEEKGEEAHERRRHQSVSSTMESETCESVRMVKKRKRRIGSRDDSHCHENEMDE